jgi:hypothetical protein
MITRNLFVLALAVSAIAPAFSQTKVPCAFNINPNLVRADGEAELVGDMSLLCVHEITFAPLPTVFIDIDLFLNVEVTSRITNPAKKLTEALLLIDEPQPGVPNVSNGAPYMGQVLGTPGFVPGQPPSGNVYQGKLETGNMIRWTEIPFNPNGSRIFRFVNVRANAFILGGGGTVTAFVNVSSKSPAIAINITTPNAAVVAFPLPAMTFTSSLVAEVPSALNLSFQEGFAESFKKRIENTNVGPLTAVKQDVPGTIYCTESGFIPEFSLVNANSIGSATTGTRLLVHFDKLHPSMGSLVVPEQVTSSSGQLVAHRVIPQTPLGADFSGGNISLDIGTSFLPIGPSQEGDLVYEVTSAAPYAGQNGCGMIESFNIPVHAFHPVPMKNVQVTGHLAPMDTIGDASAKAPTPRFHP